MRSKDCYLKRHKEFTTMIQVAAAERQYLEFLINKRDKNVEFLIPYQRKLIDREMIYRLAKILFGGIKLEEQ